MLGLSHYASSDEEEEEKKPTHVPQAVTALAVRLDNTAKDAKDLVEDVSPPQRLQQRQQSQQQRLLDSLPALQTYPAAQLDAKSLAALQQDAVDALKADLWSPQTSQQYNVSSSTHGNVVAERDTWSSKAMEGVEFGGVGGVGRVGGGVGFPFSAR
jgi:hypothetical protein